MDNDMMAVLDVLAQKDAIIRELQERVKALEEERDRTRIMLTNAQLKIRKLNWVLTEHLEGKRNEQTS